MQVVIGIADLQHEPSHYAPLDTQALFGEKTHALRGSRRLGLGPARARRLRRLYRHAALAEGHTEPTHRVAVNRTFVYQCPDLKMPARRASPLGAAVCVRATQGAFAQIGDNAFVFADHLQPYDSREKDFVAVAERFLHAPYLWGGKRASASIARGSCR